MMNKQTYPCELTLVGGFPEEPLHSDVDAICSAPGPTSFFKELYRSICGGELPALKIEKEDRTDDALKIRAWSGTPALGLEWLEEKCLETSSIPVSIECITHGLPAMKVRWRFMLEYAGQLGHAAFRHLSLVAEFENDRALRDFQEVWSKVFNREPLFPVAPDLSETVKDFLDETERLAEVLRKEMTLVSEGAHTHQKELSAIRDAHDALKLILSSPPHDLTSEQLKRCANFPDVTYEVNYYYPPASYSENRLEEVTFADIRQLAGKEILKRTG